MKINQNGFSVVEVILILVVVGLIGAGGWFVFNRQPNAKDSSDSHTTQDDSQLAEATDETDEKKIEDWLTYSAPGYTVKLADGWKLMKKESGSGSLFTIDNTLALIPGTKAVVEEYKAGGPGEFRYAFNIDYHQEPSNPCSADPFKSKSFKTDDGEDVYKSEVAGPSEELSSGDKGYYYCIQLKNNYVLTVGYAITSDMDNHVEIIESVLKTVKAI